MRRFLYRVLPLLAATIAAAFFLYGFILGMSGRAGRPLSLGTDAAVETPKPSAAQRILILGDSLARGTGDSTALGIGGNLQTEMRQRQVKVERVVNLAVNGARTADLVRQLESRNVQRIVAESSLIVVSIGGNDLFGLAGEAPGRPPQNPEAALDEVEGRVKGVIAKLREINPTARLYLIGLYNPFAAAPMGRRASAAVASWNARLLEEFREDPDFTVVQTADIFSHRDRLSADRFHPGSEAYKIIARRIAESL